MQDNLVQNGLSGFLNTEAIIMNEQKILLRASDVIEMTGYSRSTVYTLIASGELKSIKVGRSVRVPVFELQAWIERKMKDDGENKN